MKQGKHSKRPTSGFSSVEVITAVVILAIFFAVIIHFRGGVTNSGMFGPGLDQQEVVDAVENLGFTNVVVTSAGLNWYECGENDYYVCHVTATNSAGRRVTNIIVCGGPWKGLTVRFAR